MSDLQTLPPHIDCFACGTPDDRRMDITWTWDAARQRMLGSVTFGDLCTGPPRHAHGGAITTVLDEAMGGACWMAGHPVVAANLDINFRAMVPLGVRTTVEAWVERVEGRKIRARGAVHLPSGAVAAEGTSIMVTLPPERFAHLVPEGGVEAYRRWLTEGNAPAWTSPG